MEMEGLLSCSLKTTTGFYPEQINPVHTPYFLKTYFNIILPSMRVHPKVPRLGR